MLLEEIRVSRPEGEDGAVPGLILVLVCDSILHWLVLKVRLGSPYNSPRRPRWGVEVELYSFLNLGARWGWVGNATPRPLYPQERNPVPIL